MKISKEIISLLKNYSQINNGLKFTPGSVSTISVDDDILAVADIGLEIPVTFEIYDLQELLATISLFEDADFEFNEDHMIIREGRFAVRYNYAMAGMIVTPDEFDGYPPGEVSFNIARKDLSAIVKASSVLKLDTLKFTKTGDKFVMKLICSKNVVKNRFDIEADLETGVDESDFIYSVSMETLKVMPGDYNVSLSSNGYAIFTNDDVKVVYYVALDE